MIAVRTLTRSAAVLGAATALTVAGAGAASAASTHTTQVTGNDVSVTFKRDGIGAIICGAVITQVADAAGIAADLATGNLAEAFESLLTNPAVKVLKTEDPIPWPTVSLPGLLSDTVVVRDLDPNIYAVVSNCTLDESPTINPFVIVGDPLEAVMGSVDGLSSGDGAGLDTLSAVIGGGDESGLGGILSSALGAEGEGEGDLLGTLSSATGDDE